MGRGEGGEGERGGKTLKGRRDVKLSEVGGGGRRGAKDYKNRMRRNKV